MIKAKTNGTLKSCINPQKASTEKNTIAPCEKLKVAEALKIRTNPKATKEYIVPANNPPTTTSIKNNNSSTII